MRSRTPPIRGATGDRSPGGAAPGRGELRRRDRRGGGPGPPGRLRRCLRPRPGRPLRGAAGAGRGALGARGERHRPPGDGALRSRARGRRGWPEATLTRRARTIVLAAVVAGVPLLLYLCGGALTVRRSAPWLVIESASGGGAGGYALIGIAGVLAGGAFFHNLLPLGTAGELLSSGTIALASCVVGIEVAAAFTLVFSELAERGLILRRRP